MEKCDAKIVGSPICLDKVCVCVCSAKEEDWGKVMETHIYAMFRF